MKSAFIPITSPRDGWTFLREVRLGRFADSFAPDGVTIRCACGATFTRDPAIALSDDNACAKWVDNHGATHMPPMPGEPPERGCLYETEGELSDPGGSLRPAMRWPDGRVEVVEQEVNAATAPPSSGDLPVDLEEENARADTGSGCCAQ
jgi:hypothetical protein